MGEGCNPLEGEPLASRKKTPSPLWGEGWGEGCNPLESEPLASRKQQTD
jgi:hypothetical protein